MKNEGTKSSNINLNLSKGLNDCLLSIQRGVTRFWELGKRGKKIRELGKLHKNFKELGKRKKIGKWEKLENKCE